MTLVRIVKAWTWPDLNRQTPGGQGVWQDIQFSLDPVAQADYALVLNRAAADTTLQTPPGHVWAVMQEPPNEISQQMHFGDKVYDRIYTCDPQLHGRRYIPSQPALPWHVNREYDFLKQVPPPNKTRSLSWITSALKVTRGHRTRMLFLDRLRSAIEFDLWGKGIKPIDDKWDGLAPYRYAIAIENFSNSLYWSEKIADCFLAWTMPIYYGCTHITDYFPPESLIQIDIENPDVFEQIQEAVASDRWTQNQDAVAYARELVLDQYQLFPYITGQIHHHQEQGCAEQNQYRPVTLPSVLQPPLSMEFVRYKLHRSIQQNSTVRFIRRAYSFLKRRGL
ncbi:MAG TPA: glycosyltransferase family 10 [Aggregatilineaceae bacterium]|nr:glycosyltransferase family 10 [Aggregatilineaceae bacterium]